MPGVALIESANYIILQPMPLAEDIVTARYRISAYNTETITINDEVYRQSLLLSADEILCPWPVSSLHQLDQQSLSPIFARNPEVVLLGTGAQQQFPEAKIFALFGEQGIGLEVMDNGALCRTYNILIAEDRVVVAAVILGS